MSGSRRQWRRAGPLLGQQLELDIGAVANLGCCVARHEGRVVFVRHALPGERVVATVTEDKGGSFCRADAVSILTPSPDRVTPPCRFAGPGRCGGCDWQHATPEAQRRLKADVVRELFGRIGQVELGDVTVEEVPGGSFGWRTRAQFAVDEAGRPGLRHSRDHAIQPIDDCLLAVPEIRAELAAGPRRPGTMLDVAASATGELSVSERVGRHRPPGDLLHERAIGRDWEVHAGGFWQVHPEAAGTLVDCALDFVAPRPGERALDLYAGVGLFSAALAAAVGPDGRVTAIESDPTAAEDARRNLDDLARVEVRCGEVAALLDEVLPTDVAVLDPPRAGAGKAVIESLVRSGLRAIGYVSCDAATLAADVRVAREGGFRLESLRVFDLFPNSHHVECVALLVPSD